MERPSASEGERRSAEWVAGRLRELGAEDVAVEPYRGAPHYGPSHAILFALGALGRRLPAAVALALFELEYSGRRRLLRRRLPGREGANVTGRLPARGERERTLVLVAHHDAARTGIAFHPRLLAAGDRRAQRTGRRPSLALLPEVALAAVALGLRPARAVLTLAAAIVLHGSRADVVPGANDNASGVAAVMAALAQLAGDRPEGLEVMAVFPGGEEAGMDGMDAWLGAHELDPDTSFVLGLDTVGSGEPVVLEAEGGLWPVRYREPDVALVERAAHDAGVQLKRWRLGAWTDPVLARLRGLPTASVLSVKDGGFPHYHLPSDVPEHVDHASVDACVRLVVRLALAWS